MAGGSNSTIETLDLVITQKSKSDAALFSHTIL